MVAILGSGIKNFFTGSTIMWFTVSLVPVSQGEHIPSSAKGEARQGLDQFGFINSALLLYHNYV